MTSYQNSMSRRDRIVLAIRLSYAVLQFHSTPWIESNWSWKDFTTVMNGGQPQIEDPLFISHDFYSSLYQTSKPQPRTATSLVLWATIGEETLTRLGFALIELGLGKRLSELREDGSIPPDPRMRTTTDGDFLDLWTVEGVLDSGLLYNEQCEDYEEVVRVLIRHEYMENCEKRSLNSRKESFYRDVEQFVIAPLYSLWSVLWGNRMSQASTVFL